MRFVSFRNEQGQGLAVMAGREAVGLMADDPRYPGDLFSLLVKGGGGALAEAQLQLMAGSVIDLDAVTLLPGTYDLHTTVTDFNRQHIYDDLHVALRFDVMTGKPYETGGVVTLHPSWTIVG